MAMRSKEQRIGSIVIYFCIAVTAAVSLCDVHCGRPASAFAIALRAFVPSFSNALSVRGRPQMKFLRLEQ
jgi:hypothetical protein